MFFLILNRETLSIWHNIFKLRANYELWLPNVTLTSWDGANSDYAYLEPNKGIKTVYRLLGISSSNKFQFDNTEIVHL